MSPGGVGGPGIEALLSQRSFLCRLTSDRALENLSDAEAFLLDRGLLTRTPDSALPSLFEACHEDPYRPGGHGFAAWPKTKYVFAGELEQRPGIVTLKVHCGKNLLLAPELALLVAPICLSEIERMESADPDWRRLLRYLAESGPTELGVIEEELGLKPKELRSLRSPLERCGAVVSRQVVLTAGAGAEGHRHSSELGRFDQMVPEARPGDVNRALAGLLVAAVRAAVVAPSREVLRWFSWRWLLKTGLIKELVGGGLLYEPAAGYLAAVGGS